MLRPYVMACVRAIGDHIADRDAKEVTKRKPGVGTNEAQGGGGVGALTRRPGGGGWRERGAHRARFAPRYTRRAVSAKHWGGGGGGQYGSGQEAVTYVTVDQALKLLSLGANPPNRPSRTPPPQKPLPDPAHRPRRPGGGGGWR